METKYTFRNNVFSHDEYEAAVSHIEAAYGKLATKLDAGSNGHFAELHGLIGHRGGILFNEDTIHRIVEEAQAIIDYCDTHYPAQPEMTRSIHALIAMMPKGGQT